MSKASEQQVEDLSVRVATLERWMKDTEGRRLQELAERTEDHPQTLKLKRG